LIKVSLTVQAENTEIPDDKYVQLFIFEQDVTAVNVAS
jgi:hypothetical protein